MKLELIDADGYVLSAPISTDVTYYLDGKKDTVSFSSADSDFESVSVLMNCDYFLDAEGVEYETSVWRIQGFEIV